MDDQSRNDITTEITKFVVEQIFTSVSGKELNREGNTIDLEMDSDQMADAALMFCQLHDNFMIEGYRLIQVLNAIGDEEITKWALELSIKLIGNFTIDSKANQENLSADTIDGCIEVHHMKKATKH